MNRWVDAKHIRWTIGDIWLVEVDDEYWEQHRSHCPPYLVVEVTADEMADGRERIVLLSVETGDRPFFGPEHVAQGVLLEGGLS